MKLKNLLPLTTACILIGLLSCKKDSSSSPDEIQTTIELSQDQAISDNMTEDANELFFEVSASQGLMGSRSSQQTNTQICGSINVTPVQGFPKTIVIDFGNGCSSQNGITRKGKINVVISDSIRKSGSTAVMTFENYFVNDYKKEGTITWTNTSANGTLSWQRKVENGKITTPTGRFWLHNGIKNLIQTEGSSTHEITDDVFVITGSHTVTNSSGDSRTATILEGLVKQTICGNVGKGTIKIEGPTHYAIIDYGDGTCDNLATISIDGGTPVAFIIP